MFKPRQKRENKLRRRQRVRAKILGSAYRPRLSVFRSNRHIWAQLIDDGLGKTLVVANDLWIKDKKSALGPKIREGGPKGSAAKKKEILQASTALAEKVGGLLAEKALEKKINSVVFDRGPYKYHGLIKALAEGARKGGLKF